MERPRFSRFVVPETPGNIGDIISHTSSLYAERTKRLKEAASFMKEQITQGTPLNWLKPVIEAWRNQADQLDIQEQISQDEKEQIFNPAISAMKSFAKQHNIVLPDNLMQRIAVLDDESISHVRQAIDPKHEDNSNDSFTMHNNRLVFINKDTPTQTSEEEGIRQEDDMRETGIHELWHSVGYTEVWLPNNSSSIESKPVRRSGMFTSRPEQARGNYLRLQEGFTQYLTRETLRLLDKPISPTYKEELEIIDILIGQIGLDPFIQTTFSRKGFRALFNALEQRFGKDAYKKIGEALQKDWGIFLVKTFEGKTPSSRYPHTKRFLERKKRQRKLRN
ncbi:MAG: hypothetical protein Q7R51_02565 [bacterium]|nr:hypothetical protein [bacterium]